METTSSLSTRTHEAVRSWEDQPTLLLGPTKRSKHEKAASHLPVWLLRQKPEQMCADARSHPGIRRARRPNEDAYFQMVQICQPASQPFSQSRGLFLVADGMGGHNDGQYASKLIIETVCSVVVPSLSSPSTSSKDLRDHLIRAVRLANAQLFEENRLQNVFRGTTLTGVVLLEQAEPGSVPTYIAHIVNVGDSRTYRYTPGKGLSLITRDHSTVEQLISRGVLLPEERYTDKRRNQIYRCLGHALAVEVDAFTVVLQAGERLLLCSDGLWEMVRDPDLAACLAQPVKDPTLLTLQLVQAALNGGGDDNITALVVLLPPGEELEPSTDQDVNLKYTLGTCEKGYKR